MNNLVLGGLKIKSEDVLVDNGENGFWHKSWYETKYGLTNATGSWVISPIFEKISKSEDMYIASYLSKSEKRIYFINSNGKIAFNSNLNIIDAKDFKHGCSLIQVADISKTNKSLPWTYVVNLCKWGLIDKSGNVLCQPSCNYEHEVKIQNMKTLVEKIKTDGCEILNYADSKLFINANNVKIFKAATKYYVVNCYNKTRNKEYLKTVIDKQNAEFKKVRRIKLAENLFELKTKKDKINASENVFIK